MHDFNGAYAGFIGDLRALAIGRGDCRTTRQRHAQCFRQRIHRRGGTHAVAVADRGGRRCNDVDEFRVTDLAGRVVGARLPNHRAGARALPFPPAIEHRSARQHDGRNVDRCCGHQAGRRGLVAAGRENDAIERITVENFDQAEISKIAIERGGRPLAGFLQRMHREFEGDAAGRANTGAYALGEF